MSNEDRWGAWRGHARMDRASALEFGVATSGFQSEGGLNGPGEPATHWRRWESAGRLERSGAGAELWKLFPEAARRARAMGLTRFRLGVEWSRLCPGSPSLDARAVDDYAERLAVLREHGLEPIVTLLHFTHPWWLGEDFWLSPDAPTVFADYAVRATTALNEALARRGWAAPLTRLLTLNEPNMLALAGYVAGVFPHGVASLAEGDLQGMAHMVRALDGMLTAHVLAWRGLHERYATRGWGVPDVSANVYLLDLYSLGKGLFDLLRAPSLGVSRQELPGFMDEGRRRFHRSLFEGEAGSTRALTARLCDGLVARSMRPALFERTLNVLYERGRGGRAPLDHLAVDIYDPFTAQQVRVGRAGVKLAEPWEWRMEPGVLVRMARALTWPEPSLPVDIDENGMAQRRDVGGRFVPREDGVTRPMFLRGYLSALLHARVVEDLPVRAYCHWTFVDNYELGRWAPRFGLFALGDEPASWALTDVAGDDSAEVYGRIARAVGEHRGDAMAMCAALERAFTE